MDERKIDRGGDQFVDLGRLLTELGDILRRFFWLPLVLAAIAAALFLFRAWRSYLPMYASEATFTIQVSDSASGSDITDGYSYYDKARAEQLGKTFPYLIQSDLMYAKLRRAMGVSSINGSVTAQTVPDTNLFTIRVTSRDPETAKAILDKVIEIYPQVADYVIGNTVMNLLAEPQRAEEPYNPFSPWRSSAKGALAGFAAGIAVLVLCAAARKTVRSPEDVRLRLNQNCLASLPHVVFKRRKSAGSRQPLISNPRVSGAFQESVRGLRVKLLRSLPGEGCKTLLVTGTMPGEGKTTVACNLALSLSRNGDRVILADMDLRKPSVKRTLGITEPSRGGMELLELEGTSLKIFAGDDGGGDVKQSDIVKLSGMLKRLRENTDYIILDTPPCGLVADSFSAAGSADYAIYVVGCGMANAAHILDSMQSLAESGAPIVGCVINGVSGGSRKYGYGYGYGYGKYGSAYGAKRKTDGAE